MITDKSWWHYLKGHRVTVWSEAGISNYGSGDHFGTIHSIFCHKCKIHFYTSKSFDNMIRRDAEAKEFIRAINSVPGLYYIGKDNG